MMRARHGDRPAPVGRRFLRLFRSRSFSWIWTIGGVSLLVAVAALLLQWRQGAADRAEIEMKVERLSIYLLERPITSEPTIGLGLMLTARNTGKRDIGLAQFRARLRMHTGNRVDVSGFEVTDLTSGDANRNLVTSTVSVKAGDFLRWHVSALMLLSEQDFGELRRWLNPAEVTSSPYAVRSQLESVPLDSIDRAAYKPIEMIEVSAFGGDGRWHTTPDFGAQVHAALSIEDAVSEVWFVPTADPFVTYPWDFRMPGFQAKTQKVPKG